MGGTGTDNIAPVRPVDPDAREAILSLRRGGNLYQISDREASFVADFFTENVGDDWNIQSFAKKLNTEPNKLKNLALVIDRYDLDHALLLNRVELLFSIQRHPNFYYKQIITGGESPRVTATAVGMPDTPMLKIQCPSTNDPDETSVYELCLDCTIVATSQYDSQQPELSISGPDAGIVYQNQIGNSDAYYILCALKVVFDQQLNKEPNFVYSKIYQDFRQLVLEGITPKNIFYSKFMSFLVIHKILASDQSLEGLTNTPFNELLALIEGKLPKVSPSEPSQEVSFLHAVLCAIENADDVILDKVILCRRLRRLITTPSKDGFNDFIKVFVLDDAYKLFNDGNGDSSSSALKKIKQAQINVTSGFIWKVCAMVDAKVQTVLKRNHVNTIKTSLIKLTSTITSVSLQVYLQRSEDCLRNDYVLLQSFLRDEFLIDQPLADLCTSSGQAQLYARISQMVAGLPTQEELEKRGEAAQEAAVKEAVAKAKSLCLHAIRTYLQSSKDSEPDTAVFEQIKELLAGLNSNPLIDLVVELENIPAQKKDLPLWQKLWLQGESLHALHTVFENVTKEPSKDITLIISKMKAEHPTLFSSEKPISSRGPSGASSSADSSAVDFADLDAKHQLFNAAINMHASPSSAQGDTDSKSHDSNQAPLPDHPLIEQTIAQFKLLVKDCEAVNYESSDDLKQLNTVLEKLVQFLFDALKAKEREEVQFNKQLWADLKKVVADKVGAFSAFWGYMVTARIPQEQAGKPPLLIEDSLKLLPGGAGQSVVQSALSVSDGVLTAYLKSRLDKAYDAKSLLFSIKTSLPNNSGCDAQQQSVINNIENNINFFILCLDNFSKDDLTRINYRRLNEALTSLSQKTTGNNTSKKSIDASIDQIGSILSHANAKLFSALKHNTLNVAFTLSRLVYNTLFTKHKDHTSGTPSPEYERLWDQFIQTYTTNDFTNHDAEIIKFLDKNSLTPLILANLKVSSYPELLVKLNQYAQNATSFFGTTLDIALGKKLALDKIQIALVASPKIAPEAESSLTALLNDPAITDNISGDLRTYLQENSSDQSKMAFVSTVINSLIPPSSPTPDPAALPREILILELDRCENQLTKSTYSELSSAQAFMKLVNDCKVELESFPEPIDIERLRDYTLAVRDLVTEFKQLDHALNSIINSSVSSEDFHRCLVTNINRHTKRVKSLKECAFRSDTPSAPASSSSGNQTTSNLPTPGMFDVGSLVLHNPIDKDKYLKIDLLRRYINASNANQSCSRWSIPGPILKCLSADFRGMAGFSSIGITATCSKTLKLLINYVDNALCSYDGFCDKLKVQHLSIWNANQNKQKRSAKIAPWRSHTTMFFAQSLSQGNTLDSAISAWQAKADVNATP